MNDRAKILRSVNDYYTAKLAQHGATHSGVDWNSTESQFLRFTQLLRLHQDPRTAFSLNDYGCGYGALVEYLRTIGSDFIYTGYDLSAAMINSAQERYPPSPQIVFTSDESSLAMADYTVTSGIFNVRLDTSDAEWLDYMLSTLDKLWGLSRLGMAFNCLTSYSDREYMRDNLYYANPGDLFDYCKRHYSRQVALLHDYGLYEFTILVRREQ